MWTPTAAAFRKGLAIRGLLSQLLQAAAAVGPGQWVVAAAGPAKFLQRWRHLRDHFNAALGAVDCEAACGNRMRT
jgi:sarcosine oxidase gamma subunit